jgi:hypothetical protein
MAPDLFNYDFKLYNDPLLRSKTFPDLLIRALGNPDSNESLVKNEAIFRRLMIQYGAALVLPEGQALKALSEQTAQLGVEFIGHSFS